MSSVLALIAPQTAGDLAIYYLFWVLLYLAINVIWDIRTPHTEPFHIAHLGSKKTQTLFSAASFASSLLILVGLLDKDTMRVAGDTFVPIMLAGFSGVLFGVSEICPYKPSTKVFGPPAPGSHPL